MGSHGRMTQHRGPVDAVPAGRIARHGDGVGDDLLLFLWWSSSYLRLGADRRVPALVGFRVALDAVGLAVVAHVTRRRGFTAVQLDLDDVFRWHRGGVRLRHDVQMQHAGGDESYEEQVAAPYDALGLAARSHADAGLALLPSRACSTASTATLLRPRAVARALGRLCLELL